MRGHLVIRKEKTPDCLGGVLQFGVSLEGLDMGPDHILDVFLEIVQVQAVDPAATGRRVATVEAGRRNWVGTCII